MYTADEVTGMVRVLLNETTVLGKFKTRGFVLVPVNHMLTHHRTLSEYRHCAKLLTLH